MALAPVDLPTLPSHQYQAHDRIASLVYHMYKLHAIQLAVLPIVILYTT
jgi:hypothetical protein